MKPKNNNTLNETLNNPAPPPGNWRVSTDTVNTVNTVNTRTSEAMPAFAPPMGHASVVSALSASSEGRIRQMNQAKATYEESSTAKALAANALATPLDPQVAQQENENTEVVAKLVKDQKTEQEKFAEQIKSKEKRIKVLQVSIGLLVAIIVASLVLFFVA